MISGDANMSEYATALKVGTAALVTKLLETQWSPSIQLKNPVAAIKSISRDQSWKWITETSDGKSISAVDVQRSYLDGACEKFSGTGPDIDWTLREWGKTLDLLQDDPLALGDRLDWVAKFELLRDFAEAEGLSWDDEQLQSIDLAYSDTDPEHGLYYALEESGAMVRIVGDQAITSALTVAPSDTRAALRGELVRRFSESIGGLSWGSVVLRTPKESWMADLGELVEADQIESALERIKNAQTMDDLLLQFASSS